MTTLTAPPTPIATPHRVRFHRLISLSGRRRFWLPLALALLTGVLWVAFILVAVVITMIANAIWPSVPVEFGEDLSTPFGLGIGLGTIALGIPALMLAWRICRVRLAHSVSGRFRWQLVRRSLPILVPVYLILVAVPSLITGEIVMPRLDWKLPVMAVLMLMLVPLQAAAEEYVFRLLPLQVCGAWFKRAWLGIVLPVPFFVIGHGYDAWGLLAVANFAICMGVLTYRTGGIELAIVVHAVNNLTVFGLALVQPALFAQAQIAPLWALFDIALTIGITVLLCRRYERWITQTEVQAAPAAAGAIDRAASQSSGDGAATETRR